MLYVKVDEQGNPVERAKTLEVVKRIFLEQGTILPEAFASSPSPVGYALVPEGEPAPMAQAGKRVIAGIPIKNDDGTYTRTWEQEDIPDYNDIDNNLLDSAMRRARTSYLHKFADSISPLRWNSWTPEQQAEVMAWYESVLKMPDDPNWPRVAFPELPSPIKS
jgi:hypothetical protein